MPRARARQMRCYYRVVMIQSYLGTFNMSGDLQELRKALKSFAEERDWGQFHSPKNLASALSVEAAEILEHFQWLTEEQSRNLSEEKKAAVTEELADVFLYLISLSEKLGVELIAAAWAKIEVNGQKYPVDRAKGSMKKYTEY